jgi:hypothetical protein
MARDKKLALSNMPILIFMDISSFLASSLTMVCAGNYCIIFNILMASSADYPAMSNLEDVVLR